VDFFERVNLFERGGAEVSGTSRSHGQQKKVEAGMGEQERCGYDKKKKEGVSPFRGQTSP
jgi:hypothetical protein